MEIIKPNTIHEYDVRSRYFDQSAQVEVRVFDKSSQVWSAYLVDALYVEGAILFDLNIGATAERNYLLRLVQNNKELTKFLVFCTEQTDLQNYAITEGLYELIPQDPNEYVMLQDN